MKRVEGNPIFNVVLLLSTVPIAAWISWKNRNFQLDDSLIYLRYIRNFFDGKGLTYNAGDHFNGLTSPLYSYLLIAANAVVHSLQFATIFLSFVFLCLAAIYGAAIVTKNRYEQALCGFFVVSFNYFYTTFGMETTLFLFLTTLTIFFYKNDRLLLSGLAIGLVILTRAEGVFLGGAILCHYLAANRRLPPFKYLAIPAAIILANLFFNYIYYGSPLPATGSAKIGQGRSGFWGTGLLFLHVEYMKDWFFGGNYRMLWFMFPTMAIGLLTTWRALTTRLIIAYLVLLGAFYIFLHIPNYHWYYGPFFYFLTLFSAVGAYQLARWVAQLPSKQPYPYIITAPVAAVIFLFSIHNLQLANISRGSFEPYRNIGNWIDKNTPPNSVVAAVEIGTIGWYAHRYVIDILGLTNPYNADFVGHKDVHSWLTKYSPDYIVVHDPLWSFEASAACLTRSGAYVPTPGFNFPGYQLLGKSTALNVNGLIIKCGRTGTT